MSKGILFVTGTWSYQKGLASGGRHNCRYCLRLALYQVRDVGIRDIRLRSKTKVVRTLSDMLTTCMVKSMLAAPGYRKLSFPNPPSTPRRSDFQHSAATLSCISGQHRIIAETPQCCRPNWFKRSPVELIFCMMGEYSGADHQLCCSK